MLSMVSILFGAFSLLGLNLLTLCAEHVQAVQTSVTGQALLKQATQKGPPPPPLATRFCLPGRRRQRKTNIKSCPIEIPILERQPGQITRYNGMREVKKDASHDTAE